MSKVREAYYAISKTQTVFVIAEADHVDLLEDIARAKFKAYMDLQGLDEPLQLLTPRSHIAQTLALLDGALTDTLAEIVPADDLANFIVLR